MTEGEVIPCIKAGNVRNLLGELYVFCQKTATQDDVTMVELWNKMPLPVREYALQLGLESLPKILEDTHKQAADRAAKILVVLEELKALTSLEGEQIPVYPPLPGGPGDDQGPFDAPNRSDVQN